MFECDTEQVEAEMNLPSQVESEREYALFEAHHIPEGTQSVPIDVQHIKSRDVLRHTEPFHAFPQTLFFIPCHGGVVVGRKLVSSHHRENVLMELHCCQITSSMLLGFLADERLSAQGVTVYYHPFKHGEKESCFSQISSDRLAPITYKYVHFKQGTVIERTSPSQGWSLNENRADNLGAGEAVLRDYTLSWLQERDLTGKVVYDPACSTGQFLSTIKAAYPDCITVGQDLSESMAQYAKRQVDQVFHLDARFSPLPGQFADVMFVRFLNAEVVNTQQALTLYASLVQRVKPGGFIILFGHTPLLLSLYDMMRPLLQCMQCTGVDSSTASMFQYFVFKVLNHPR